MPRLLAMSLMLFLFSITSRTILNEIERDNDVFSILGAKYIISERVIEILNKLCPNNFETFEVKIVNAYPINCPGKITALLLNYIDINYNLIIKKPL